MKETFMTTSSENPKKENPNQKGSSEKEKYPPGPNRGSNGGSREPPPVDYGPQEKKNKL